MLRTPEAYFACLSVLALTGNGAPASLPPHVKFYCHFDEGLHACQGAPGRWGRRADGVRQMGSELE